MLCYELMPNHCLHHCFPTVDCSRFGQGHASFLALVRVACRQNLEQRAAWQNNAPLCPPRPLPRFAVLRPVFEATLAEFGVKQKVISQPHIYLGMWPAWLRGTSWACSLVSKIRPCPQSYWGVLFGSAFLSAKQQ